MKYIVVGYNQSHTWLSDYTDDFLVYDRSDTEEYISELPQDKVIRTENIGNADYDKLTYLIDNYNNLPDIFLWGKTNLFKYISKEEFEEVKDNKEFTPLLTKNHKTYGDRFGQVCYYQGGIYYERNDSWYLTQHQSRISSFAQWASMFGLPNQMYIPFAPGGNYILTRERVHRYAKDFYIAMRNTLPYAQLPGEAHMCERSYYLLWS